MWLKESIPLGLFFCDDIMDWLDDPFFIAVNEE